MGNVISTADKIEPVEAQEVRPFPDPSTSEESDDFKTSKNRHCTDIFFLILMASFLVVLGILVIYCVIHGNIYRILNGYDNCTNVCGMQNYQVKNDKRFECKGKDFRHQKLLLVSNPGYFSGKNEDLKRICVKNCSEYEDYHQVLNRCLPNKTIQTIDGFMSKLGWHDFFEEATEDLVLTWKEILYLCLIGFVFSVILVALLRFFVGLLVWGVLIGVVLFSIGATTALWYLYSQNDGDEKDEPTYLTNVFSHRSQTYYLVCAIVATVVTLCVVNLIFALRKRIKLVVQLFIEAGKSITAMPLLLLQPVLTLILLLAVIITWFYFCLWIQSAGYLTYIREEFFAFKPDVAMKIAGFWNLFAMLWMCQFIIGCQHMILAGSVAIWYFTRNKKNLGNPILYSFHNLVMYHLGSVCLGSLLIATVNFIRIILAMIQKYLTNKTGKCAQYSLSCCQCCMYGFEKFLKYISRNAYIEIAMYGKNFCQSGRQAFKILVNNSLRVAVINSIGDFVLILTKVLVVLATVTIGIHILEYKEGLQYKWVPLILAGTFTYFVAHCFITVYEMAIDTIFLCFCEDCEQNDGVSRPYYMSKNLMNIVQNYKKAMPTLSQAQDQPLNTIIDKV